MFPYFPKALCSDAEGEPQDLYWLIAFNHSGARLRKTTLNIEPDGLQHPLANSVALSDGGMTDSVFMLRAKV